GSGACGRNSPAVSRVRKSPSETVTDNAMTFGRASGDVQRPLGIGLGSAILGVRRFHRARRDDLAEPDVGAHGLAAWLVAPSRAIRSDAAETLWTRGVIYFFGGLG